MDAIESKGSEDDMAGFPRKREDDAQVYEAIKSHLTGYELPPGKRIPVRIIADRLHVSTEPVQQACRRLVEEGWAIDAPSCGFLAWNPENNALTGLYEITRTLSKSALFVANIRQLASEDDQAGIRRVYDKLSQRELTDDSIATYTGELFFEIVALTGAEKAKNFIRSCNERLYYLRKLECLYLENTANELVVICELALAWRQDELEQAINAYHDRRRELLPNLIELLKEL